jgi:hypothetical protein
MEWNIKRGRIYLSKQGTTRAYLYYFVRHEGVKNFTAGYYTLGRDVTILDRGLPRVFSTVGEAKAYCEKKDRETLIIEGIPA